MASPGSNEYINNWDEETPEIGIFMFQVNDMHELEMASIGRRTKQNFRLIYVYEPGTAHENMNKIFQRGESRYLAVCDDDVVFLDDYWLRTCIQELQRRPDIGLISPAQFQGKFEPKTQNIEDIELIKAYRENRDMVIPCENPTLLSMSWVGGCVMVIDRARVPHVCPDVNIPGTSQMSDLDLCLQVRSLGFKVCTTTKCAMFHPFASDFKMQDPEVVLRPTYAQNQCEFMHHKWGSFFSDNAGMVRLEALD